MDADLTALAAQVLAENRAAGRMVATAESCTGGMVAAALTDIAGSSDVFDRGFVTYSNQAKMDMLDVSEDMLATFGAVSVATAWAMARGALAHSGADVAVSITGIAGPGGATPGKPVGMVVFARAVRGESPEAVVADTRLFGDLGRSEIRRQAALVALELLRP
ncbi:CinA family protein [Sandarakinorhabdus sp.]|uniref:CinA family protein n=1 Tax=Sandarakinorhabdus sp. TaxID=1916663 RepID=UPI00333F82D3